jgi:hypothetical protein
MAGTTGLEPATLRSGTPKVWKAVWQYVSGFKKICPRVQPAFFEVLQYAIQSFFFGILTSLSFNWTVSSRSCGNRCL